MEQGNQRKGGELTTREAENVGREGTPVEMNQHETERKQNIMRIDR